MLHADEDVVFRENYADQMAQEAIIKNDELIREIRKSNKFDEMSEFHRRVEQLTNIKLIEGIPDSFKIKVKSSHFQQQIEE